MKVLSSTILLSCLTVAAIGSVVIFGSTTSATVVEIPCKNVEMIFARGSGQKLDDKESKRFKNQLEARIPEDKISRSFYELGTESYGGHQYPAVDVGDWRNGNAVGAWVSAGYANDYGKSVDAGVGELYTYLTERHKKCKDAGTHYVLGGYSQGAQVVGQTLPKLANDLRGQIVFSALFGDPKLYLPESVGKNPPACQGKDFSPWRRIIGDCKTNHGLLGARVPYLPTDVANKTGLWCYSLDFICGTSNNLNNNQGHGRYGLNGHAIDIATSEIITRLGAALPSQQADYLVRMAGSGAGSSDLDIAFVLDTTGSMSDKVEQAKAFIRASAEKIQQLNGRISLTLYKDSGDEYTAKVVAGLSTDTAPLLAALDGVRALGGGDTPEAALHALMTTFNTLDWKDGATKAIILLTDAEYHDPDNVDGTTLASVTKRSLEIDPVNIYPVVSVNVAGLYQPLADRTAGQVITDTGDTLAALTTALTKIAQRPIVSLKNTAYSALPGQEITFDASDSTVQDATITQYDWDFNGDGTFDQTTTEPRVNHIYTNEFNDIIQVRATASNDTVGSASASVFIGTPPASAQLPAPSGLTITTAPIAQADTSRTITLNWNNLSASPVGGWNVTLGGISLGTLSADRTSIEIRDVAFGESFFGIAGIDAEGVIGEYASATLPAYVADTPPPAPTPAPKLTWLQKLIIAVMKIVVKLFHW